MRRVFVDTSVLFPFSVMDLLLALSEDAVRPVLWTDDPARRIGAGDRRGLKSFPGGSQIAAMEPP